jgi:hypothetical protein
MPGTASGATVVVLQDRPPQARREPRRRRGLARPQATSVGAQAAGVAVAPATPSGTVHPG